MNGTVAFPIFLLQFDKEQLCIGCFHTSYRLFAKCFLRKQSLHCNISLFRTLPYSCLCFQISVYQFTDSLCPSTIFTSSSKSVFTCFSNSRRERHGFLPFGSLSVGSSFQLYTKCGFPSIWYLYWYFLSALTLSPGLNTLRLESRLVCPPSCLCHYTRLLSSGWLCRYLSKATRRISLRSP